MSPIERVQFAGSQGHTLAGSLDLPPRNEPTAFAIFAHCFTCSKDFRAPTYIGRTLARHGIAVLRFDFTGLGESAGEFAATTFSSNIGDLLAAARYLATRYRPPALLIGHSLGGTAALHAARQVPSATAVVTIASPASPAHLMTHFEDQRERIERAGAAEVVVGGRAVTLTRAFLKDLHGSETEAALRDLDRALLVFHSPQDRTVGIEHATRIFKAARHPKSFISLDRADHLLSEVEDARYVGRVIAAWADRYLGGQR